MIRTHHPSLAFAETVYLAIWPGEIYWVVGHLTAEIEDTHAGGLEIHIMPDFYLTRGIHPCLGFPDLVPHLFPRQILDEEDCRNIRLMFPGSCGCRVWIAGYVTILFATRASMNTCRDFGGSPPGYASSVGGLQRGYQILDMVPSVASSAAGSAVRGTGTSCIGLRLRMPEDGRVVITTVTHGFVFHPLNSPFISTVASWMKKYTNKLLQRWSGAIPGFATTNTILGNSPLGRPVLSALTGEKIGTISETFDQPSAWLPYSAGYKHDLSLISPEPGRTLPVLTPPPGMPQITGWGNIERALQGEPVFMTAYVMESQLNSGSWKTYEGAADMTIRERKALIEGVQYLWDTEMTDVSRALLWRTTKDGSTNMYGAEGFSGTILCLGTPYQKEVKALLFQNFQLEVNERLTGKDLPHQYVKGGFFLPSEIRQATIESSEQTMEAEVVVHGTFPKGRASTQEFRNFTA